MPTENAKKRCIISILLALIFALLCIYFTSINNPKIWDLQNPLFWIIFTDRLILGIVIAIAGAYTYHPLFGFRLYPWLRGFMLGILISLPLAISVFITFDTNTDTIWNTFILTLLTGAIYGLIIDMIATNVAEEGKKLIN